MYDTAYDTISHLHYTNVRYIRSSSALLVERALKLCKISSYFIKGLYEIRNIWLNQYDKFLNH